MSHPLWSECLALPCNSTPWYSRKDVDFEVIESSTTTLALWFKHQRDFKQIILLFLPSVSWGLFVVVMCFVFAMLHLGS